MKHGTKTIKWFTQTCQSSRMLFSSTSTDVRTQLLPLAVSVKVMVMKSILRTTILILCVGDSLAFTGVAPNTPLTTISYKTLVTSSSSSSSSNSGRGENSNWYDSLPSQDEIARQKSEAYSALSSFHETTASLPMATSTSSSQTFIQSLIRGLDDIDYDDEKQSIQRPEYWMCQNGAINYAVPMDPAAGLKRGTISKPYRCSVRLEMDIESDGGGGIRRRKRGLRLVESIQHEANAGIEGVPFLRSIPLGENVDVDAVDGSYSLDVSQLTHDDQISSPILVPLLPPSLLGYEPMLVQFLVEHTLAVSETERCRCFLLYGDASVIGREGSRARDLTVTGDCDSGVDVDEDDYAIAAAKRAKSLKEKSESDEMEKNYRLLSVILAEEIKVMPKYEKNDSASKITSQLIESSTPSESMSASSSPLSFLEMNETNEIGYGEMNKLIQSLQTHNDQVVNSITTSPTGDNMKMEQFSLGMFGLSSGVWLGDTFIREHMPLSLLRARESREGRNKGFDLKNKQRDGEFGSDEDRFASWSMGVQKVALRFEWDYSKRISQSYTYGKVMGTATSLSSMANIKSDGTIVVNESRPTRKREELRVIWDMDGGTYVAGLLGSCYFRAPRYLSFSRSMTHNADAYLTEFMVFYRPCSIDNEVSGVPEYYCSRSCRLYAKNCSLQQGSTAFLSLKRVSSDQ